MKKLECNSKYIVLPVNHTAQIKSLKFIEGEEIIYDLAIGLDYHAPDFYAYINIEPFKGKTLYLASDPDINLEIEKSDSMEDREVYKEKYRPAFHFTCKRGWLNDPNGLVFYKGIYHMFYQYNPVGRKWGNMHWGHAISKDLIYWTELDPALYPDKMGMMYSGSAIIDKKNVTGLKVNEEDVILLFYTSAGSHSEAAKGQPYTQCLAYSIDGGNNFIKYDKNPLVPQIVGGNRDPKIIYHEKSENYTMALFLEKNKFALLTSKNLLKWDKIQELDIEGEAECPDFYPLPLDGDSENVKWVFIGALDRYIVGSFDGYFFKAETGMQKLQYGENSYAAQSWSDIEPEDGRRIRITWNRYDLFAMPFNSSMTFPCEMKLKSTSNGVRLFCYPISEIEKLYKETEDHSKIQIEVGKKFSVPISGKAHDITLKLSYVSETSFNISLFGMNINGDTLSNQIKCMDSIAPLCSENGIINLRLLIDVMGVELYINEGQAFMCCGFMTDYNINRFEIDAIKGNLLLEEIKLTQLKNIFL